MSHQIKIIKGNIFNSSAQTLVNTVNTVGIMGSGIALEFRLRYPEMFKKYAAYCKQKQIQIGKLWLYKTPEKWILNFPTKEHWKDDSKIEYLEKGLQKFLDMYEEKEITSIAFPLLGANHGNLSPDISLDIMKKYLEKCSIPVEIYDYDPNARDDLYYKLKNKMQFMSIEEISNKARIQKQYAKKLLEIFNDGSITSISRLTSIEGIGIKTLEKVFDYLFDRVKKDENKEQLILIAKENLKPVSFKIFENYVKKQKRISNPLYKAMKAIIENKK